MSMNLSCVERTRKYIWRVLRSQKEIHFLHWKHLRKLLCKPKDGVATEGKTNAVTVTQYTPVNLNGL